MTIVNDYNYDKAGYFIFNGGVVQLRILLQQQQIQSQCFHKQLHQRPELTYHFRQLRFPQAITNGWILSAIIRNTHPTSNCGWQYSLDGENYQRFTYQGESGPSSEEYAAPLNSDIYIKPIYQKTVSVTLSPVVFYDAFGIRTYNQEYLDLQNPYVSINDEQFTTFPIVLNFDTDLRLVPVNIKGIDPGYDGGLV